MAQTVRTNLLRHRICQDYEGDLYALNIPLHAFVSACKLILAGIYTSAQVSAFFGLSAGEQTDWDSVVGRVTAYSNTINTNSRDRAIGAIESTLMLYELRQDYPVTGYTTPDEVWSRLMVI